MRLIERFIHHSKSFGALVASSLKNPLGQLPTWHLFAPPLSGVLMHASFTGNLLVASSSTTHPLYSGGVCLVVHQDEDQAIGVMLNRPMDLVPDAAAILVDPQRGDTIARLEGDSDPENPGHPQSSSLSRTSPGPSPQIPAIPVGQLHFGGPMSGPVVALHRSVEHAEMEPGVGIYVAAQREHLEQLVQEKDRSYRLIVGHLKWTGQELTDEIETGIWHVLPATADNTFLPARGMWPRLVRRATTRSLAGWLGTPDVEGIAELN